MRSLLAALAVVVAVANTAHAQTRTIDIGGGTAEQNLVERTWPVVRTPWRQTEDLEEQIRSERWDVLVVVDEHGQVAEAIVGEGPTERREEARALVLAQRYRPFEENGEVVRARFITSVLAQPEDYHGPADRSFPARYQGEDVLIRLMRGGCYGECPVYTLEIRGDGQVRYVGIRHVAQEGERRWTIPRERVMELIETVRRAEYFSLRGYYTLPVFHLSTQVTSVRIGGQEKFVFNYGTSAQFNATTIPPEALAQFPWSDQMAPLAVVDVEDAIDRIAGVEAYVGARSVVPQ